MISFDVLISSTYLITLNLYCNIISIISYHVTFICIPSDLYVISFSIKKCPLETYADSASVLRMVMAIIVMGFTMEVDMDMHIQQQEAQILDARNLRKEFHPHHLL